MVNGRPAGEVVVPGPGLVLCVNQRPSRLAMVGRKRSCRKDKQRCTLRAILRRQCCKMDKES